MAVPETKRVIHDPPRMISRDITLNGVEMTVWFWYYPHHEATESDPGCPAEIEIDAIYVDEFDVAGLFGEKAFNDIEQLLWKMIDNKEEV
jgi:hypothetical protein